MGEALSERTRFRWGLLAALVVAALACAPLLQGDLIFDDTVAIVENRNAHWPPNWHGILTEPYWGLRPGYRRTGVFRPLTTLTHAAWEGLFGLDPLAWRAGNIALHLVCTALVGLLAFALGVGWAGSALAAALYGVLPVHVDALGSAANRTETLCAALYLGALLAVARRPKPRWAVALGLFALALEAKEMAVTWPAAAALTVWALAPEGRRLRRVREAWPVWAASVLLLAGWAAWRVAVLEAPFGGGVHWIDNPIRHGDLAVRLLTPLVQWATAWEVTLVPVRLSADYTLDALPVAHSLADPRVWAGLAAVAAYALATAWGLRRRPRTVGWGLAFFGITYALVSNTLVLSTILFAERNLYLPTAGLVVAAGGAFEALAARRQAAGRIAWATAALLVAAYGVRHAVRAHDWRAEEPLFRSSLRARPGSARMHANLGRLLTDQGKYDEAERHLRRAVAIAPDSAPAWLNLGVLLHARGQLEEARKAWLRSAGVFRGAYAPARVDLCLVERKLGHLDAARRHCEAALRLRPNMPTAHAALAEVLAEQGDTRGAFAHLRQALQQAPRDVQVLDTAGRVYRKLRRWHDLLETLFALAEVQRDHPEVARDAARLASDLARAAREQGHADLARTIEREARRRLPAWAWHGAGEAASP